MGCGASTSATPAQVLPPTEPPAGPSALAPIPVTVPVPVIKAAPSGSIRTATLVSKAAEEEKPAKLLDRYDSKAALAEATKLSRIELPELPAEKRWVHRPGFVAPAEATDGTPRFPNAPSEAAATVEAAPSEFWCYSIHKPTGDILLGRAGHALIGDDGTHDEWESYVYRPRGLPVGGEGGVQLFEDTDFGYDGFRCCRPGRGEGLADGVATLRLFAGVAPNDLTQGRVGNCWLISLLAALAEYPALISSHFEQTRLALDGKYEVTLYDVLTQAPVRIVVDDRLPIDDNGDFRCVRVSPDGELWPCLLEKALAKYFGGQYGVLDGDHPKCPGPLVMWQCLTGALADESLELRRVADEDGLWECNNMTATAMGGYSYGPAPWPLEPSSRGDERRDGFSLLPMLNALDDLGCIMTAATSQSAAEAARKADETFTETDEGGGHLIDRHGLVVRHAYSLIDVELDVAGSGLDFCQLRNPWAKTEWNGPWCDGAAEWSTHPAVRDALRVEERDDGVFWMCAADFLHHFGEVTVCLAQNGRQQKRKQVRALAQEEAERAKRFIKLVGKCVEPDYVAHVNGLPSRVRADAERAVESKPDEYCGYLVNEVDGAMFLCKSGCDFFDVEEAAWSVHLFNYESIGVEEREARHILSQADLHARAQEEAERAKRFAGIEDKCAEAKFTEGTPGVERAADAERLIENNPEEFCAYLLDAEQNVYLCKAGSDFFDSKMAGQDGWSAHIYQYDSMSTKQREKRGLAPSK